MKVDYHHVAEGKGNAGECYAVRLDESGVDRAAWLRVDERRESLHLGETEGNVLIDQDTYIADHCFAGGELFWSRMEAPQAWSLRTRTAIVPTCGRGMSLSSYHELFVWEERQGKRTRVRLLRVHDGWPGAPVDVTDGSFNAYDPVVARLTDGSIAVLYSAFRDGNYRICAQRLTPALEPDREPVLLSDQAASCVYPSVWPARDGGFWFSYTAFDVPTDRRADLVSLLKHPRHLLQRQAFTWRGRAYVGLSRDGQIWSPVGSPGNQCIKAGMIVQPSVGAAHTRVFETESGQLGLLLRQHTDPRCPDRSTGASRPGIWQGRPENLHPNLSLSLLEDKRWSEPVALTGHLNMDAPISMRLNGRTLTVAYDESLRATGWGRDGEWFHADAAVGVGSLTVELSDASPSRIELRPFAIAPYQGNNLVNPDIGRRDSNGPWTSLRAGFLHALGQTHTHSNLSVCCREIDRDGHFNYRFLQDVLHCDFGAVTDHAYNMTDIERLITRKLAEFYYFPGEFVAIPAYEWTGSGIRERGGPWGHVNPLWLEEDGDLDFYTPVDADCAGSDLKKLGKSHAGQKVVAPPHHPADSVHPYKWQDWDAALSPVVEIFQDCRGAGEQSGAPGTTNFLHSEQDYWVVDWLKKGLRFGFIAGGDHTGIALAGLLVRELTRTGLYEAFMARRTFATTGIPARVEFTANDAAMGTAIVAESATFRLTVETPEPIADIQLLRDGEHVESLAADDCRVEHTWIVNRERPGEFWYARILLENGEIIWTSPIWMT